MKYTEQHFVHYFFLNEMQKVSPATVAMWFQEAAIMQSEELGIGLEYYDSHKLGWVLNRYEIDFFRMPEFKETVTITTEPVAFRRFYGYRVFEMRAGDELLAKAKTLWVFMNSETRRPQRVNEDMINSYCVEEVREAPFEFGEIGKLENTNYVKMITPRYSDIDTNHHINNTRYIEYAFEALPFGFFSENRLINLKVLFKKECGVDEIITSNAQLTQHEETITTVHEVSSLGNLLSQFEAVWEPKV